MEFTYSENLLSKVRQREKTLDVLTKFGYKGAMLSDVQIDFSSRSALSDAKFSYEWTNKLALRRIFGRIGGQRIPDFLLAYDAHGRAERIADFSIQRSGSNSSLTYTDGVAILTVTKDAHSRDISRELRIRNRVVMLMNIVYDEQWDQVLQVDIQTVNSAAIAVGGTDGGYQRTTTRYSYDSDGQLTHMRAQDEWLMKYDKGGNLAALHLKETMVTMGNQDDRLVKFGGGYYKYNEHGFVVENAAKDVFLYDGRGLLVKVTQTSQREVVFEYDHLKRLVARRDSLGNVTQFFYSDPR